jgi:hypothetical protein
VERVQADGGVRDMRDRRFAVDRGHVHADRFDALTPVLAQGLQELAEHVLGAAFADEHDFAGVVVGDHGQEFTAFAVGDLIHADPVDAVQAPGVEVFGDQPAHQRVDCFPGGAQQRGHGGLAHLADQPAGQVLEIAGMPGARTRPRHPFGAHPLTGPAIDPADLRLDHHPPPAEIDVPPAAA